MGTLEFKGHQLYQFPQAHINLTLELWYNSTLTFSYPAQLQLKGLVLHLIMYCIDTTEKGGRATVCVNLKNTFGVLSQNTELVD